MRILVTGGAGFIGSALALRFKREHENAEVFALDNLRRRGSESNLQQLSAGGVEFIHGDVRNPDDLSGLTGEFDLLIDAAAEPSVHAGNDGSPQYVVETNLFGTFNCLTFARRRVHKFILLSTSRVYSIQPLREITLLESSTRFDIAEDQVLSGISRSGISEDFPTSLPRSLYGATKLSAECLLQEFASSYGLQAVIYRCGVIAGPGQFGKVDQGVFTHWVASHYFKKRLQYVGFGGGGKQVRDLLHIDDLCDLILRTLATNDALNGSIFNIGGGRERSVSLVELTSLCQTIVGTKVPILSVDNTSPVDIPLYISDCRKITRALGWGPTRSLELIISDVHDWIHHNESKLKHILT